MIGMLGLFIFTVSQDVFLTFKGLSISRSARYSTHELYNGRPALEYLGPSLESATMTVRLDVSKGVNPAEELKNLKDILESGEAQDLIIGDENIGQFVLESFIESLNVIDGKGNVLVAEVALTLKGA